MFKNRGHQTGFTLVELLIVIIVIAILAAVSVVAYGGMRQRAINAALASDATSLGKAIKMYETDTGSLPTAVDTNASGIPNAKLSATTQVSKYTVSGTTFRTCLLAIINDSPAAYNVYDSAEGTIDAGAGSGPADECTPPLPEFVNGIRCPVITFGTPFVWNSTTYRVRVTYSDPTISRITRIGGTATYIDQGAVDRHDFPRAEGINWNNALMDVRGSNGLYRYDCRVTWYWPAD